MARGASGCGSRGWTRSSLLAKRFTEPEPAVGAGHDETPWRAVREATAAVATAVEAEDRDALEQALSALTEAARGL